MDVVRKFEIHADECRRMARLARELESKAVWNRMADRWLVLAANEMARTRRLSETRAGRAHAGHQSRAA